MSFLAIIIAVAALIGFFAALSGAVMLLDITVGLWRQGPRAVEEAHRRGDSISAWLDPSKAPLRSGPHHEFRKARAGRKDKRFGVVAVTERASTHFYGK